MKTILLIVSLVALNSSVPIIDGGEPLFFINLSFEIEFKILLVELEEILFLKEIFF